MPGFSLGSQTPVLNSRLMGSTASLTPSLLFNSQYLIGLKCLGEWWFSLLTHSVIIFLAYEIGLPALTPYPQNKEKTLEKSHLVLACSTLLSLTSTWPHFLLICELGIVMSYSEYFFFLSFLKGHKIILALIFTVISHSAVLHAILFLLCMLFLAHLSAVMTLLPFSSAALVGPADYLLPNSALGPPGLILPSSTYGTQDSSFTPAFTCITIILHISAQISPFWSLVLLHSFQNGCAYLSLSFDDSGMAFPFLLTSSTRSDCLLEWSLFINRDFFFHVKVVLP